MFEFLMLNCAPTVHICLFHYSRRQQVVYIL
jgi:hypothetical protein